MIKNKGNSRGVIIYIITIIFSILYIFYGNRIYKTDKYQTHAQKTETATAKVTNITDVELNEFSIGEGANVTDKKIIFDSVVLSGDKKGKIISAYQSLDGLMAVNPKDVEIGDRVLLAYVSMDTVTYEWVFDEYKRSDALIGLGVAFLVLVILFGRKKGVNTIVSLIFTCLAIFAVFIPSILSGHNIYKSSIITCLFIITMTLLIISGVNKKAFCAAVGCLGGLTVTAILTVLMDKILHLTGAIDQEAIFLVLLNDKNPIDLRAIIFGGIVLGSLGATMDVSMSISSSLQELSIKMKDKSFASLLKSGLAIGRDIMGTMANTLILAYIGSSLTIVLLLVANTGSLESLFNRELIVVEVMQALVGSMGILFTIPITSILSAYIYNLKTRTKVETVGLKLE